MTPGGYATDQPVAMPWYRTWDTAAEHEHLAAIHRSKAAELEADYEQACGNKPARRRRGVAARPLRHRWVAHRNRGDRLPVAERRYARPTARCNEVPSRIHDARADGYG